MFMFRFVSVLRRNFKLISSSSEILVSIFFDRVVPVPYYDVVLL